MVCTSRDILMRIFLSLILGCVLMPPENLLAQEGGTITGTVSVRGMRNSANVVVYIDKIPGKDFAPPDEHAIMDQVSLTFIPHVLPVLMGTSVDFPNNDEVRHNVFTPSEVGGKFNLGQYPKGTTKTVTFDKPGVVTLLCNTHTEMSAYILVLETPYAAVTEVESGQRAGRYTLTDVPPGTYVLKAWHRRATESEQTVEVTAGKTVTADFSMRRK